MSADPTTHRRFRTAPPDTRPEILVGVDVERMANEAVAALALEARCYQRGGQLVQVVTVPQGPPQLVRGIKRYQGSHTIVHLPPPALYERLTSAANWRKLDGRSREYKPVDCPAKVVGVVGARGQWDGVRPLVAVATCPQLRPDGSVLQTPGYDEATGILYWPSDDFPEIHGEPTIEDARGALRVLREVVADFPFARPEHESAWLAGVLTMVARPAIEGPVPLFAVDATTRGTGKSRLVDAAVFLAHGTPAARTTLPDDDEEMRKRITSLVLDGDPAICLDNITQPICLPSLDAVITSTLWKDRLLGKSANVTAPHRATWWATGNNLVLAGDLARRTMHVRLESTLENPEERTGFTHPDLLEWVKSHRRALVAAALTLLRAYVVSGAPSYRGPLWGSFEHWTRLIAGALTWLNMPNPLRARATQQDDAGDVSHLRVFLHGIRDLLEEKGQRSVSARELLSHVYEGEERGDLREAVEAITWAKPGKPPSSLQLAGALRRHRGRVLDRMRIVSADPDSYTRVVRWSVELLDAPATDAPTLFD